MYVIGRLTSFHSNEVILECECQTTLELTLYLSSWRPSFKIYLKFLSTQGCELLNVMIVSELFIERRVASLSKHSRE